jgi:hypothetical protein
MPQRLSQAWDGESTMSNSGSRFQNIREWAGPPWTTIYGCYASHRPSLSTYPKRSLSPTISPPFQRAGVGAHAPGEGVGEGAQWQAHPMPHLAIPAPTTGTIGGNVSSRIVHGPMYVRDVDNPIHECNAPMENTQIWKNKKPAMKVIDTILSNIAIEYGCCDNRQVETEQAGWTKGKATWLCARTPQHHVACVAAPSGERAERAPHASDREGHRLATTQPPHPIPQQV